MKKARPANFAEYVDLFPKNVQPLLKKMRQTIRKAAPKAEEKISYGMPAYTQDGILVWFAAHNTHLGFYPRASGIEAFKEELSGYKNAKGSVQFPFDKPLPVALITQIVKFRVKENSVKVKAKKK